MEILIWVIGGVVSILALWCLYRKHQEERAVAEMAGNANLIIQYLTALHEFGVDSDAVRDFKIGKGDNVTFLRMAEVLDHVFREHARVVEKVDCMWKGK